MAQLSSIDSVLGCPVGSVAVNVANQPFDGKRLMQKLGAVTQKEIETVLERLGWVYDRTAGSHKQYIQPGRPGIVTVKIQRKPYHDITLSLKLRQIGISKREFAEALREAR